jgi:Putative transposase
MFDRLFTRASAVAHRTTAAYAEERARYPQSCERPGDSGSTVQADDLLWMHVLPQGFHRIRYYGLLTSPTRANNVARIRALLAVRLIPIDAIKAVTRKPEELKAPEHPCPCCGSHMRIIETFLPRNSQSI